MIIRTTLPKLLQYDLSRSRSVCRLNLRSLNARKLARERDFDVVQRTRRDHHPSGLSVFRFACFAKRKVVSHVITFKGGSGGLRGINPPEPMIGCALIRPVFVWPASVARKSPR
jgi:hypothetical protein